MIKTHAPSKSYRFRKALGIILKPEKFNASDLSVITVLRDFCRDGNECWPKISTVCRDTMLSKRTVMYSLNKLESEGMIRREIHDKKRKKFILDLAKICDGSDDVSDEDGCNHCTDNGATIAPYKPDGCNHCTDNGATIAPSMVQPLHQNEPCIIEEKSKGKRHSNFFLLPADVPDEKKKKILSLMNFFEEEVARQRAGQEVSEDWILAGQRWLVEMASVLDAAGQRPHHQAEIQELVRRFLGSDQKYFEKQLAYAKSGGYRLPIEHISKQQQTKNESESYREPAFQVYRCGQK